MPLFSSGIVRRSVSSITRRFGLCALQQSHRPGPIPQFSGESVLDLGCGYGCYTDYFRTAGADVIGIDGSEKMIELARADIGVSQCGWILMQT